MSTELSNGVIIPEEYSDDWYDEMSINLRKLNDVITAASDNATDIQRLDTDKANSADLATVATSGSYTDLNNKPSIPTKTSDLTNDSNFVDTSNSAVSSGITSAKVTDYDSHIADTDIHVTAADKQTWNSKQDALSQTQLDAVNSGIDATKVQQIATNTSNISSLQSGKADDNSVVHTSGNETCTGNKGFVDNIIAKKIVSNVSQLQINAKTNANSVAMIGGDSASDGGGVWVFGKNTSNKSMVTLQVYDTDNSSYHAVRLNMDGSLTPTVSNNGLGSSSSKWVSFNGLKPSALGMPDLSNGVDISGYISSGSGHNEYTPLVDGWISVILKSTSGAVAIFLHQGDFANGFYSSTSLPKETEFCAMASIPVKAGAVVNIDTKGVNAYVYSAKFYPCLGNV